MKKIILFTYALLFCSIIHAQDFITVWQTTTANENITIPTTGSGYNYTVNWGDGTSITTHTDDATHSYIVEGTYIVSISGSFPRIHFNNAGDKEKIKDITQWGANAWTTMEDAFWGCTNLQVSATDAPDLSNVTTLRGLFEDCTHFNGNINHWNVSTIIDMYAMLREATAFNQPLNNWDVSNVINMQALFKGSSSFNQPLNNWDVSKVTTMWEVFWLATSFNQDISMWKTHKVTNMKDLFYEANAFNQNLGNWDISSITTMEGMLFATSTSTVNYDATLIGWATDSSGIANDGIDDIPSNITFNGGTSTYCTSTLQRQNLKTNYSWDITDEGTTCTYVPDNNFETYLETHNANDNVVALGDPTSMGNGVMDDYVNTANIDTVTSLDIQYQLIYDMTGIEGFIALKILDVSNNGFSRLNLSKNTALTHLSCYSHTNLKNINLSNNSLIESINLLSCRNMNSLKLPNSTALTYLNIAYTPISSLDVSKIINLEVLIVAGSKITSLDVSKNLHLVGFNGDDTPSLTSLNIKNGNNANITMFYTDETPNLKCIEVDNSFYSYNNWTDIDPANKFSDNCDGSVYVPDDNFETYLETHNANGDVVALGDSTSMGNGAIDDYVNAANINTVTSLDVSSKNIEDLKGIEGFTALEVFKCNGNEDINWLDLSKNTALKYLDCSELRLNSLNLTYNTALISFKCTECDNMNSINLINSPLLTYLDLSDSHSMANLGISNNIALKHLDIFHTRVINLDVSTNIALEYLEVSRTQIKSLDLSKNSHLTFFDGEGILTLTSLNIKNGNNANITLFYTDETPNLKCIEVDNSSYSYNNWTDIDPANMFSENCATIFSFISLWETTTANETITIPTEGSGYNYTVYWGDGTNTTHTDTDIDGANAIHTYAIPGTYKVSIAGAFPRIFFFSITWDGKESRIKDVLQWGSIEWESMQGAFYNCNNLKISATDAPDLSNVSNLSGMFTYCSNFNSDINHWDVSNITNMNSMFVATSFNQPLNNWDVSKVTDMSNLFYEATAFDQNLSDWDIGNITTLSSMFTNAGLSTANYDATLIGWQTLDLANGETKIPININFDAGSSTYCAGKTARNSLTATAGNGGYGWTIGDAGIDTNCTEIHFISTWETTTADESITIPTEGIGYNYTVNWGDGTSTTHSDADLTTNATHIYATAGSHTLSISGDFPRIYFNDGGDKNKLKNITQWGSIKWSSMEFAFWGCINLEVSATDAPDLSNVNSLRGMFAFTKFNSNINHWNVGTIINMGTMFYNATLFNQPLNNWNVSNATSMISMFRQAIAFNQPLNNWM